MSTTTLPIPAELAARLTTIGTAILRYGIVAILLLIGGLKFTHAEAMAIQPLIAHSPLMSWLYAIADVDTVSRVIGTTEIVCALLIATRAVFPLASALGSAIGICTFLATLSFILSTPGVWDPGFPALSATGSFLIKDLVLLGACVFTAGEALLAAQARR
jgi:uncharacterized membrane protein YkgB